MKNFQYDPQRVRSFKILHRKDGRSWHFASSRCGAIIRLFLDRSRHRAGFYEYTAFCNGPDEVKSSQ